MIASVRYNNKCGIDTDGDLNRNCENGDLNCNGESVVKASVVIWHDDKVLDNIIFHFSFYFKKKRIMGENR